MNFLRKFLEQYALKRLIASLLVRPHLLPDWSDEDRKRLEGFLASSTGEKLYQIMEFSVRSQFEALASSRSLDDIRYFSGSGRGLSMALVLINNHRVQVDKVQQDNELPEMNLDLLATSEPTVYGSSR